MQARARAALANQRLSRKTLGAAIGRSPGAVGRALNETPAKASPTLRDIFNHLCSTEADPVDAAANVTRQLAAQAPESAGLLAAVFEEVAALLRAASVPRPDKRRMPST